MTIPKAISTIVFDEDTSLCKSIASLPSTDEPEIETIKEESDEEEEISNGEMAHSNEVMYEKLVGTVTGNRGFLEQLSLLKREKSDLINPVNKLKDELLKQKESVNELE